MKFRPATPPARKAAEFSLFMERCPGCRELVKPTHCMGWVGRILVYHRECLELLYMGWGN